MRLDSDIKRDVEDELRWDPDLGVGVYRLRCQSRQYCRKRAAST